MDEIFNQEYLLGDVSSGQGFEDDIPVVEISSGDVKPDVTSGNVEIIDVSVGDVSGGDASSGDVSVSGGDASAGVNNTFVCECSVAEPTPLFEADIQKLDTTDGLLLMILLVLLFIAFVKGGWR